MADEVYLIKKKTLEGIADALRERRNEKEKITLAQIEEKIRLPHLGISITCSNHINPTTGEWERPIGWPNLDDINIPDDYDGWYLTYDLKKTSGYGWIGIVVANAVKNTPYYVERGHIENGNFIVDESHEINSADYFRQSLDEVNGDIQLWRVRSDNHITHCHFAANTTTNAQNYPASLQPCVERCGKMPYVTDLRSESSTSTSSTTWRYTTFWLERDAVACGGNGKCTRMDSAWSYAYSLQSLDLSKWNTSEWIIPSLASCWQNCYSLQSLDLSKWNTMNWKVTSLSSCWNSCYSLRSIDFSGLDTSNWIVNTLASCWSNCYSLQSLILSNLDTSNWVVTNLSSCWNCCYSLQILNVLNWNTTNWKVTTLSSCWSNCRSLYFLDLSKWDTSNWIVNTLASCWNNCDNLQLLDISNLDTSNWVVTTLSSCWSACYNLRSLDLSKWDVSNWKVTTLASCWSSCFRMQSLLINDWVTTEWKVTALNSCWGNCYSLPTLEINNWDTTNWKITTLNGCWSSCYNLQSLDISKWDTTNWAVTDTRNLFSNCYSLKILNTPASFGTTNAANNNGVPNVQNLETFSGYKIEVNVSFNNALKLTHQSLVNMINRLPTVTATKTLTIGAINKLKLTEEEIAIATEKGWTVA